MSIQIVGYSLLSWPNKKPIGFFLPFHLTCPLERKLQNDHLHHHRLTWNIFPGCTHIYSAPSNKQTNKTITTTEFIKIFLEKYFIFFSRLSGGHGWDQSQSRASRERESCIIFCRENWELPMNINRPSKSSSFIPGNKENPVKSEWVVGWEERIKKSLFLCIVVSRGRRKG